MPDHVAGLVALRDMEALRLKGWSSCRPTTRVHPHAPTVNQNVAQLSTS